MTTSRSWRGSAWSTGPTSTALRRGRRDGTDRHDLVFDGLDTVATSCELNGNVARRDRPTSTARYRFDVASALVEGANELEVRLPLARSGTPTRRASLLGARPAAVPAALRGDPQVGLQLRVGLGHRDLHQRHLAAGAAGVLVDRPPRPGARPRRAATAATAGWRSRCGEARVAGADALAGDGTRSAAGTDASRRRRPAESERTCRTPRGAGSASCWWPAGLRRAAAVRRRRRAWRPSTASSTGRGDRRVGFRTVRWDVEPRGPGTPFTAGRQRPAGLRQGRQLDPRRRLPRRVDA